MNCLQPNGTASPGHVDFDNYTYLHSDGHRLISGWFKRAWDARDAAPENSFEPFIFAWFAINGWASCVTGEDVNRIYIKVLSADQAICDKFNDIVQDSQSLLSKAVKDFSSYWPIFEVKDLRRRGILRYYDGEEDRRTTVERYLSEGAGKFEPECWEKHKNTNNNCPIDWPHTLAAIYKVRCNLFHGEKAAHSEMDQLAVLSALKTLLYFFREAKYL